MYFTSIRPTWRKAKIDELLSALRTLPVAALIKTGMVHLLSGLTQVNPTTPVADLVAAEATYTGYTALPLPVLIGPVNLTAQVDGMLADVTFLANAPVTVPDTITGYFVDENTGGDWVLAEIFPEPLPIAYPGDFVELKIAFPLPLIENAQ